MTRPVLVLVHGRAQGGKDEAELKALWLDTLKEGLGAARREALDGVEVRFPFYGGELDHLAEQATQVPANVMIRGDFTRLDPGYLEFQREFVERARKSRNITDDQILDHMPSTVVEKGPMQWGWVQATLRTLDGMPGLSGEMIERFTRDVYLYLNDYRVRRAINAIVGQAIKPGERMVVVGHSLGSIVAYDVLRTTPGLDVPLYFTVGSPLAIRAVRTKLAPIRFPAGVAAWYNAFDRRDAVALYPLDVSNFNVRPPIENYAEVQNGTDNAHGIIGYLNDSTVASRLLDALI
jgi:pimeloyl-ACP methyl ester carboxylesterase